MSASSARRLLRLAAAEEVRLTRHLLVAAALREVLSAEPIVVGGTAEEFYTLDDYHETDLDLCGSLTGDEESVLADLGFERQGRYWVHVASKVPVEFPESRIDGDEGRVRREPVGPGQAAIIGVEDLYLDRVRQATVDPGGDTVSEHSALAIAAATFDVMDWSYVEAKVEATNQSDPRLGIPMRDIDRRVRRAIRRST